MRRVGFGVDGVLRLRRSQREPDIHGFCQQEHCSCEGGILRSALRHTVKIVVLIFAVTLILNLAFLWLPHQKLQALWSIPVLGELVAAILGLFPQLCRFGPSDGPLCPRCDGPWANVGGAFG